MIFNSYSFIAFFLIVLALHYAKFPWKVKKINLLIASYVFYAAWNPPFVLLLMLSTVVDFFVGKALYHQQDKRKRKLLLIVSLAGNLGILCFFKYGTFLLENFVTLVNAFGIDYHPAKPNIILPVGISFYTFTTLCYTIDMYRKDGEPVKSLLDFSLFVTFFPHLVAGPIVRPKQLVPQFATPKQANRTLFTQGLFLLTLGLFMKVVLADALLTPAANQVFNTNAVVLKTDAWVGIFAFAGQVFFDFAGYSTCAMGAAMCLGFWLPRNFNFPYASIGFTEFWKRWHITLSSWLRDYLYIPLGGNRKGEFRTHVNLILTMLLGGLWHGASWNYIIWGGLNGVALSTERLFKRKRVLGDDETPTMGSVQVVSKPTTVVSQASFAPAFLRTKSFTGFLLAGITFILICTTYVFVRAQGFGAAVRHLNSMYGNVTNGVPVLSTLSILKVLIVVGLMFISHWVMRNTTALEIAHKMKWWMLSLIWSLMLILLILSQESSGTFFYFQF